MGPPGVVLGKADLWGLLQGSGALPLLSEGVTQGKRWAPANSKAWWDHPHSHTHATHAQADMQLAPALYLY